MFLSTLIDPLVMDLMVLNWRQRIDRPVNVRILILFALFGLSACSTLLITIRAAATPTPITTAPPAISMKTA